MALLFYTKPDYISKERGPLSKLSCRKYVEIGSCSRSQLPPELSWENVMEGKTLPPCSISDFMDYLIYVAHDAENLQFWLWLRDYTKRFNALPAAQKRLSRHWVSDDASTETFVTPITWKEEENSNFDVIGQSAYHRAAVETERFAKQPFRKEISQITAHYILPDSPRELNLSYRDRSYILTALSKTTHPSAFARILELTTITLRNQSHPNFIRWSICNGNQPRVYALRSFAILCLTLGCIISLILILSKQSRWFRIIAASLIWLGTVNVVVAARGLCILLFRSSTREEHPWEIGNPLNSKGSENNGQHLVINLDPRKDKSGPIQSPQFPPSKDGKENKHSDFEMDLESFSVSSGRTTYCTKLEPLGPSNKYADETWVTRWQQMLWIRKLNLRKVWVKEEALRILQNKIVLQAHIWGAIVTITFIIAVVACPVVGLY